MRLLLDTHTLIWWLANNNSLREEAKKEIAEANNQVFVSAASAWEIAIKKSIGKLKAPNDLADQIENKRFTPLAIDINHALAVEELPLHHQDPFDRILIAQAMYEQLTIVTRDRKFNIYNIAILPA